MAYVRSQWDYLQHHPADKVEMPDIDQVVKEVWDEISSICTLNPVNIIAYYNYKRFLEPEYKYVLATASRTMYLFNNEWQSGALLPYNVTGSILIQVNPYVPNGWNVDNGSCDVGYHYDLRTVLRHEILHGIGVSSSITPNGVGYSINDHCYPYAFDNHIVDSDGNPVVTGCQLLSELHADKYVNGEKLYNPDPFEWGSSLSHVDKRGVMYAGIPCCQCLGFDSSAFRLLNELGAKCDVPNLGVTSGVASTSLLGVYIVVIMCIKCLLFRI